ncbi:hypothetical protein G5714_002654 [Onychostoma macrolepis]|uniref:DUF4806 domain-containing protein n=1 Tax=Onychostoma macrolepis TaxID=369639 RepID=A0A7J6D815_9TELE|nr:hypothetical protein G5714_002654 [Onychostoma macrolepis]
MEDFELQEQHLSDAQAFDTLVLQISRIGGRNTKDCVHKVLDRLFTNSLMAKFNLKGKGKRGKRPLEGSKVYIAIQDGIMKFDSTATEDCIKVNVSDSASIVLDLSVGVPARRISPGRLGAGWRYWVRQMRLLTPLIAAGVLQPSANTGGAAAGEHCLRHSSHPSWGTCQELHKFPKRQLIDKESACGLLHAALGLADTVTVPEEGQAEQLWGDMRPTVGVQETVFDAVALAGKLHELYWMVACLIVGAAA